ncbi:hypothetical protein Nepgr_033413 [Nepenthes gracilis]|uniref:Uncharacterized protein n=1 Tax=Nepenthes gracilis TaxID=150966 RepID=A0AAD3TLU5_NEPGR|nr:hypothetical protein Nepgr_033413 [Nepenthes gracilis]
MLSLMRRSRSSLLRRRLLQLAELKSGKLDEPKRVAKQRSALAEWWKNDELICCTLEDVSREETQLPLRDEVWRLTQTDG